MSAPNRSRASAVAHLWRTVAASALLPCVVLGSPALPEALVLGAPPWRVEADPRVDRVLEIRSRDCDPDVVRTGPAGSTVSVDFPSLLHAIDWMLIPAGTEVYTVDVLASGAMSVCRGVDLQAFDVAPGDPRRLLASAGLTAAAADGDWAVAEGGLEEAYAAAAATSLRFEIARARWSLADGGDDLDRVEARLQEMASHATTDVDRAALLAAEGQTARRRGDYPAARGRLAAAQGLYAEIGESGLLLADLELNRCTVLVQEGDSGALACLEALEPLVASLGSDWFEAGLANTRGGYHLERFELDQAAVAFERVLEAAGRYGDSFFVPVAGSNLGLVYAYAGMHDESVNALQQSLEAARAADVTFGEAIALVNLGWSSLDLRDAGRARIFLERALSVTKAAGFEREYWSAQAGMGEAARLDGDYETAFELLRGKRDWEQDRTPDSARVIGAAWIRLLRALIEGGEFASAADELAGLEALLGRAPESVSDYFSPELQLAGARLALADGDPAAARVAAGAAEAAFAARGLESTALEALAVQAQALRALAPDEALAVGRAFVTRSVQARLSFADTQDGVRFGEAVRRGISEHVAFLLKACGDARADCEREAFRVVEIERALATERERLDAADAPEVVAARLRLAAAHRGLASALAAGDELGLAAARVDVTARARDFRRLGGVQVGPEAVVDEALAAQWPEALAYVSYWVDGPVSVAFVRDSMGLRVVPLAAPERIEPLLQRFRRVIANPRLPTARAASALGDEIFAPLGLAGSAQVAISPQGLLHRVPFAALHTTETDGARSVLERHPITLASGIGAALRTTEAWQPASVTIVAPDGDPAGPPLQLAANALRDLPADTRFALDWPDLAWTRRETQAVAALFSDDGTELLLGAQSRLDALMASAAAAPSDVVHFATHGFVFEDAPSLSGLVLAADEDGTARLAGANEFRRLALGARLVVLNGCRTVGAEHSSVTGYLGLRSAFVAGGADEVVSTFWDVPDRAAADLVIEFYGGLRRGDVTSAEALRDAQLALQDTRYGHPYYWAGYSVFEG